MKSQVFSCWYIICCFIYIYIVCTCVFMHIEARGWCWVLSSVLHFIFFEVGALTEPGAHQFNETGWQEIPRAFLTVLTLPLSFFVWVLKDTNSSSHACTIGTFWLDHLPGLCLFFSVNQTMRSHDPAFFTFCFIATSSRECLKCKAIPHLPKMLKPFPSEEPIFPSLPYFLYLVTGPAPSDPLRLKAVLMKVTNILYFGLNFTVGLHWTCAILLHLTMVPRWPEPDETGLLGKRRACERASFSQMGRFLVKAFLLWRCLLSYIL